MKRLIFILFLILPFTQTFNQVVSTTVSYSQPASGETPAAGGDVFVATTGSDVTGDGSIENPYATIQKGVDELGAGDTLYIRGGIYYITGSDSEGVTVDNSYPDGSSGNLTSVMAYDNILTNPVIIDCDGQSAAESHYGMLIEDVSYWYFYGITVRYVYEYNEGQYFGQGVWTTDLSNVTFERCTVHNSAHGFFIQNGTGHEFINCDAHDNANWGNSDPGGYADGFVCNLGSGTNTALFQGCRSWNNSDDGFDCYGSSGYITWNRCWAWNNGYGNEYNDNVDGNGAGFKFGANTHSLESQPQRMVYNCLSWSNKVAGYDKSVDGEYEMTVHFYNNVAYLNGENDGAENGSAFSFDHSEVADIFRNNIAFGNYDFYTLGDGSMTIDHNNFDEDDEYGEFTVSSSDFVSVDDSDADNARESDGSLPEIDFLHLTNSANAIANIINGGVDVDLDYDGDGNAWDATPSMGAFEYVP